MLLDLTRRCFRSSPASCPSTRVAAQHLLVPAPALWGSSHRRASAPRPRRLLLLPPAEFFSRGLRAPAARPINPSRPRSPSAFLLGPRRHHHPLPQLLVFSQLSLQHRHQPRLQPLTLVTKPVPLLRPLPVASLFHKFTSSLHHFFTASLFHTPSNSLSSPMRKSAHGSRSTVQHGSPAPASRSPRHSHRPDDPGRRQRRQPPRSLLRRRRETCPPPVMPSNMVPTDSFSNPRTIRTASPMPSPATLPATLASSTRCPWRQEAPHSSAKYGRPCAKFLAARPPPTANSPGASVDPPPSAP